MAAAARTVVAGIMLGLLASIFRKPLPKGWRTWLLFLLLGLCGSAVPFFLLAYAVTLIDSMEAAVLMSMAPLFITVFAVPFALSRAKLTRAVLGLALGLGGAWLLVAPGGVALMDEFAVAKLYVVLAAVFYGLTVVLSRAVKGVSTEAQSFGVMLCSIVIMLVAMFMTLDVSVVRPSAASIAATVVLGIISTALASYLYYYLVQRVGPSFVAPNIYLVPPIAIFAGAEFMDEVISAPLVYALILILAGTILANLPVAKGSSTGAEAGGGKASPATED